MRLRLALALFIGCLPMLAASAAPLRVCLDFFPNPNHVPLYVALERGLFGDLDVEVIVPANPSDPVKLAATRTIDVCLTPQINFLIARSEGLPLISIGALIDHGLGGLLALGGEGIASAEDLSGRRIGYSLAPLEPILWETMLGCVGIPVEEVEMINVGYATVASLLSRSVDAVGAFRNFETIQVELWDEEAIFLPQEEYCVPETFDIIFVVHPGLMETRSDDLREFLDGLAQAMKQLQEDPEAALETFFHVQPDLGDELNRRSFEATVPLFAATLRHDAPEIWLDIQDYLYRQGLVADELPLDALYTTAVLPREGE